jgi:hypothetical protein
VILCPIVGASIVSSGRIGAGLSQTVAVKRTRASDAGDASLGLSLSLV